MYTFQFLSCICSSIPYLPPEEMYWAAVENKQVAEAFNKIVFLTEAPFGESFCTAQIIEVSNTVPAKNEQIVNIGDMHLFV